MVRALLVSALLALLSVSCKNESAQQSTPAPEAAVPSAVASAPAAASPSTAIPVSSLALPADDVLPRALSAAPAVSSAAPKPKPAATASAKPATTTTPKPKASAAATTVAPALPSAAVVASTAPAASPSAPATTPPEVTASDPAADALAQRVDAFYMPLNSLIVRFEQEFYVQSTGMNKKSSGVMKFQRPGKMSWRYDPPNGNLVVCDGKTVWVYEADGNQYTQQPFQASEYAGALGFLSGEGIRKYFTFRFHDVPNFPGGKVLLGTPRTPNAGYDLVLFYVDLATANIRRVVIIDAQRNRNRFDLESLSEAPIDPREFVWSPPPGATLIAN